MVEYRRRMAGRLELNAGLGRRLIEVLDRGGFSSLGRSFAHGHGCLSENFYPCWRWWAAPVDVPHPSCFVLSSQSLQSLLLSLSLEGPTCEMPSALAGRMALAAAVARDVVLSRGWTGWTGWTKEMPLFALRSSLFKSATARPCIRPCGRTPTLPIDYRFKKTHQRLMLELRWMPSAALSGVDAKRGQHYRLPIKISFPIGKLTHP